MLSLSLSFYSLFDLKKTLYIILCIIFSLELQTCNILEYANWWTPITEDITVDKNKGKKQTPSQKPKTDKSQVCFVDMDSWQ